MSANIKKLYEEFFDDIELEVEEPEIEIEESTEIDYDYVLGIRGENDLTRETIDIIREYINNLLDNFVHIEHSTLKHVNPFTGIDITNNKTSCPSPTVFLVFLRGKITHKEA